MTMRIIRFPRWEQDVRSKKRTLMHLPVRAASPNSMVAYGVAHGEIFMLLPAAGSIGVTALFARSVAHARVVRCEIGPFDQWTMSDITKLNLRGGTSKRCWDEYRKRCIALWGDGVDQVFRIEFEYVDAPPMPEECLAA